MTKQDLIRLRLFQQQLVQQQFIDPTDVVAHLGAVQSQDFSGGKWAIGLRLKNGTDEMVEKAIRDRKIVRTWPMRGTLHFVLPTDIHWMLKLLTPRIIKRMASRFRELELDDKVFDKSVQIFTKALQGGRQVTRPEMMELLAKNGVNPSGQRGIHIVGYLAQRGMLCLGPREGKQHTFVLLDEWIPQAKTLSREESLAKLAKAYFTGHGPATLADFVWWTGLIVADAKNALSMVKSHLEYEEIENVTYWFAKEALSAKMSDVAHLLPNYDEYIVGYKDRSAIFDTSHLSKLDARRNPLFNHTLVIGGKIVGAWTRVFKKERVVIHIRPFAPLTATDKTLALKVGNEYGRFFGAKEVQVVM